MFVVFLGGCSTNMWVPIGERTVFYSGKPEVVMCYMKRPTGLEVRCDRIQ